MLLEGVEGLVGVEELGDDLALKVGHPRLVTQSQVAIILFHESLHEASAEVGDLAHLAEALGAGQFLSTQHYQLVRVALQGK